MSSHLHFSTFALKQILLPEIVQIILFFMYPRQGILKKSYSYLFSIQPSIEVLDLQGISTLLNGNIITVDKNKHCLFIFSQTGEYLKTIGQPGPGPVEFSGPRGVSVDFSGNILVGDSGNQRVQVLTSDGAHKLTITDKFADPWSAAAGPNQQIIVSDGGNGTVSVFSEEGSLLFKLPSSFQSPRGVAVDYKNNIYVVNNGLHKVDVFDQFGSFIKSFDEVRLPQFLCVDRIGGVAVSEWSQNSVMFFPEGGKRREKFFLEKTQQKGCQNCVDVTITRDGRLWASAHTTIQVWGKKEKEKENESENE